MGRITKVLLFFVVTACLVSPAPRRSQEQQTSAAPQVPSAAFTKVESSGEEKRYFFTFTTGMRTFTIRNDGWGESGSSKILRRNLQLRMGRKGQLTRMYYLDEQRDLLLFYEINDGDYGWGFLERMDQTDLQPRWITTFNGFNLGPGLVEGNAAYLSAANLLAKVDLRSGKYDWQLNSFRSSADSDFSGFRVPLLFGDHVRFEEDAETGRAIEVDKASGKIISSQK